MSVRKGEIDAGPLRVRALLVHTYGECSCCGTEDELDGGMCKFCLSMLNDSEADPKKNHKRGREPLTFTGKVKNVRKKA